MYFKQLVQSLMIIHTVSSVGGKGKANSFNYLYQKKNTRIEYEMSRDTMTTVFLVSFVFIKRKKQNNENNVRARSQHKTLILSDFTLYTTLLQTHRRTLYANDDDHHHHYHLENIMLRKNNLNHIDLVGRSSSFGR